MPNGVGRLGHFVSSLRKKREVLLHLSREKKIANQERIYNCHWRLLSFRVLVFANSSLLGAR
jgi:hypothetical protein